jgi:DNA-binding MarR family transcriptional regulator
MAIDFVTVLLGVLLAATVAASVEYYRQIRKAQKEYEKAKGVVEDIVLSFNRELKREADKLDVIAFKIEGNLAKADTSLKKVDTLEKRMAPIENQIGTISQTASQSSTNILSGLTGLESKIKDIEASHETLKVKIAGFEEQIQKFNVAPEISEPVIHIKRDKAMAALTDTEIAVLEMLSSEGPKTAPEIKDRVKLSREHTARLMKKLYEEGYLEREVGKIPFRYTIKKEMEKLLKKPENSQPT